MVKVLIRLTISVCLFFALWLGFSQINWVSIFNIKQNGNKTEEKLGDLIWQGIKSTETEIVDKEVRKPIKKLFRAICEANNIDEESIKLHIIKTAEVNAFALPNRHLVVNSALILSCENESELCGVIGHEIAHIEKKHVMKKLVKELGLSAILTVSTGKGGKTAHELIKMLSSTAYDRTLETEADIKSVDYLHNAEINPEPFGDFLYRLSENDPDALEYFSWINTHPDSKERGEYIIEYSKEKNGEYKPVLTKEEWDQVKTYLKGL